jgi:phosphoribosylglycinamide formyltransferase 2
LPPAKPPILDRQDADETGGELVTDGSTEGQQELVGKHERAGAPQEEQTTALVLPPRPRADVADAAARPRVVLLGADEPSKELAIALSRLGAEVIVVDSYPDAPAHWVADQSLVIDMTDADELSSAIREVQPEFVATLSDAVSVDALDSLAVADSDDEFTELVPGARGVRISADREGLRRLAADELGLPTAPFWFAGSVGELQAVAAHAGFPLLIKPVDGAADNRHSVIAGPDELEAAWQRAAGPGSGSRRVQAETVVEVESYVTLLAVRSDSPKGPVIDFCAPIGHRSADGQVLESWQPQQLSTAALDAAKSIAARIIKALGGCGVFAVELMINGDEVYFADVTAGPRESAWVTLRSQRLSAFELQARVILGLPVDTVMVSPGAARVIKPLDESNGESPSAEALTAALGVPESDVRVFARAAGSEPAHAKRKLGVVLATGPDLAKARERAREVAIGLTGRRQP